MHKYATSEFEKTKKAADLFYPHSFQSKVKYNAIPRICVSTKAYNDMYILVDEADEEISWLGTVRRDGMTYHIEEIFLLNQECSYSQTELKTDSIAQLGHEILLQPDGLKKINSLRFWGHSHHNMGTSPSGQDVKQLKVFIGDDCEYAIRGILNKKGRIEFTMFFQNGIEIEDVPWMIQYQYEEQNREAWVHEIKDKVKKTIYSYDKTGWSDFTTNYVTSKTHGQYCRCIECTKEKKKKFSKIIKGTTGLDKETRRLIATTMGIDDVESFSQEQLELQRSHETFENREMY